MLASEKVVAAPMSFACPGAAARRGARWLGRIAAAFVAIAVLFAVAAPANQFRRAHWLPRPASHRLKHHKDILMLASTPRRSVIARPPAPPQINVPADATAIHVSNEANVPSPILADVETAVEQQIDTQLRPVWHTPAIRFTAGAGEWTVHLTTLAEVHRLNADADGVHTWDGSRPSVYVAWQGTDGELSINLSHEMIEALTDPTTTATLNGRPLEVADPVYDTMYFVDNEIVSDFVYPAWFTEGSGPYDYMAAVHAPASG